MVQAARVAREQIRQSMYESPRKRGKPEWVAAGMPDAAPAVGDFIPANGLEAVSFEHTHGKMLMTGLRPRIHQQVGGASQATNDRIYSATDHLQTPTWIAAFMPPEEV